MSIERILQSLLALIDIHHALHEQSQKKTDVLKKGTTEDLQKILTEEQTLIRKLEQAEEKREKVVDDWFTSNHLKEEERTLTRLLELLPKDENKYQLEQAAIDLTKAMAKLRDSEQLNQALLQQSMHFIQASLNMLQPTLQSINYNRQKKQQQTDQYQERSMFDSRA